MMRFFRGAATLLWPPPKGAPEEEIYLWRISITVTLLLLGVAIAGHSLLAKGIFPTITSGYALSSRVATAEAFSAAVEKLEGTADLSLQLNRHILSRQLEDIQERLCSRSVTGEYRANLIRRKVEVRQSYYDLFGVWPYIPDCDEVNLQGDGG